MFGLKSRLRRGLYPGADPAAFGGDERDERDKRERGVWHRDLANVAGVGGEPPRNDLSGGIYGVLFAPNGSNEFFPLTDPIFASRIPASKHWSTASHELLKEKAALVGSLSTIERVVRDVFKTYMY